MTRESWSRPSSSVPSRWPPLKMPRRGLATPVALGSGRWIQLAKMASRMMPTTQPTLTQKTGPNFFLGRTPASASLRLSIAAVPPVSAITASAMASLSASANRPLDWAGDSDRVGVGSPPFPSSGRLGAVRVRRPPVRSLMCCSPLSHAMADPRVDQGVDHIDHEIDEHVAECDQHHRALHDEVVALEDRGD